MSAIFGLVAPANSGGTRLDMARMARVMRPWGLDGLRCVESDQAHFGQAVTLDTPEARAEHLPHLDQRGDVFFTAEARLDNRDELIAQLDVPRCSDRRPAPDGDLVSAAYARWGLSAPQRLYGDWSFAAWHPRRRVLIVARDHVGNTAVYYACVGGRLVFASDIRAILQVSWVPRTLDEVHLARRLVQWMAGASEQTAYLHIRQVPPGHFLKWADGQATLSRYWRPEQTNAIQLASDDEYANALREHLRVAVRSRLRCEGPVVSTLSSGLDSGAVTAVAADVLAEAGKRLTAVTAVPAFAPYRSGRKTEVLDEAEGAARLTRRHSSIDHVLIDAREISPLQGLAFWREQLHVPVGSPRNAYWLKGVLEFARRRGASTLLTGQAGNITFSWAGPELDWLTLLRQRQLRRAVAALMPPAVRLLRRRGWDVRALLRAPWRPYSPIRPGFAREVDLFGQMKASQHLPTLFSAAKLSRVDLLLNGVNRAGAIWNQLGPAVGVDVRDPLQDRRLIEFVFGVPDRVWIGPQRRWLARQAMRGILPEETRRASVAARQAADVCERLMKHPGELRDALDRVDASPLAQRIIDVPYCRRAASFLQSADRAMALRLATFVLLPGLQMGAFLSEVERGEPKLLQVGA